MMTKNRANSSNQATQVDLVERRSRHLVFSVLTAGLILAVLIAPFVSVESALAANAVGDDPCITCPLEAYSSTVMAANPELMVVRRFAASREVRPMSGTFRELDLAANPEPMAVRRVAQSADEARTTADALGKASLHPDVVHGLVRQGAFNESPVGTTSPLHPDVVHGLVRQGAFNESPVGATSPLHPDVVFGLVPPAGT
jgi:hypothetical protein